MSALIKLGCVYRPKAPKSHCHVIVSPPPQDQGPVLVVNWTTLDEDCIADACVLGKGDRPKIDHSSAVAYSRARLCQVEKTRFTLENGNLEELEPLSADVLRRIVEGGWKSKELRGEWKAMLPPI